MFKVNKKSKRTTFSIVTPSVFDSFRMVVVQYCFNEGINSMLIILINPFMHNVVKWPNIL